MLSILKRVQRALSLSRPRIGLDIGTEHIKLVVTKALGDDRRRLMVFDTEPTPVDAIANGQIMNPAAVTGAIRLLLARNGLRSGEAILAVPASETVLRVWPFPQGMSKDELEEAVSGAVEHDSVFPLPVDQIYYDYSPLGEDARQSRFDVLLAAVKRETIQDYVTVARDAGLNVLVVEPAPISLANALEVCQPSVLGVPGLTVLVNIGATYSTICLLNQGTLIAATGVPEGGHAITERIGRRLQIGFEEAERLKLDQPEHAIVQSAIQEVVVDGPLVGQLWMRIEGHVRQHGDKPFLGIYLTGGSALPVLLEELQRRTDVPVEPLDPFAGLEIDAARLRPGLRSASCLSLVAFGLSLREKDAATEAA